MGLNILVTVVFGVLGLFFQNYAIRTSLERQQQVQQQVQQPQYYFDQNTQKWYCFYNNQWWVYNN